MPLIGHITPPGDKSISHRLIILSLLAKGEMLVSGLSMCNDVLSSLGIFRKLGGQALNENGLLRVTGLGGQWTIPEEIELNCGNSGTTMRLLMGLLAGIPGRYILDGDAQLRRRPMERVAEPLRLMSGHVETLSGRPPVTIVGRQLSPVNYKLSDGSAQLKGAVLLAGLSASGPSTITECVPTREHTERLINHFGGYVDINELTLKITPGPLTLPPTFETAGDPSSAAFFLVSAAIIPGSQVTATNMLLSPSRTGFLRVLERMGAKISLTLSSDTPEPIGEVSVTYNGELGAVEIDASEVPSLIDEIPILALAATQANGHTIFHKVDELRIKETDRLMSIRHQLGALGARISINGDDLHIIGPSSFIIPESLDSGHDHRLAMTLTMALLAARARIPIIGTESIPISYPNFEEHLSSLWRE